MHKGFTLVELSIVLVILGLLIGGILAGQSLIRSAELRSITTDFDKFRMSTHAFRDKYLAVPGDMTNATAFWGSAGGNGANVACTTTDSGGTPTCNGNGDGFVQDITSPGVTIYEDARYWQHLANAGLIEGRFNGVWPTSGPQFIAGTNVPASKIGGIYYIWGVGGTWVASATDFGGTLGNAMNVLGQGASNEIVTPAEAWGVDSKIDDGKPATGTVISNKGTAAKPCTSNANTVLDNPAATYTLSNNEKICALKLVRL